MTRFLSAVLIFVALVGPAVADAPKVPNVPTVSVRYGEHENFSRLVFDWPKRVPYTATLDNGTLTLDFKALGALDLQALRNDPPTAIKIGDINLGTDDVKIGFKITKPATLRHFRDGPRVVVDVLFDSNPSAGISNASKSASSGKTTDSDVRQNSPEAPSSDSQIPSTLKVKVSKIDHGMRMTFPWKDNAAAAVFQRAGQLWVVFDEPAKVDFSAVRQRLGDRFVATEQVPNTQATVLRFTTSTHQHPEVRKKGTVWTIDLTNVKTRPAAPIDVREQMTDDNSARVFMPIKDPGLKLNLSDPLVGDKLVVVTVLGSGFGIDETRNYAEFRLIGSPQGVVIEPKADWLKVDRVPNGVEIAGVRALAHSVGRTGKKAPQVATVQEEQPASTELIDFDAWSLGSDADYWKNLDKLLYSLSMAPNDGRNAARWKLAKFYLAHRQAADALGVLGLMAQSDVRLEEDPQFRAVRGVANIFMHRYADALKDLSFPRLDAEPHAALWRAVAESQLGKNDEALDDYHQGLDAITQYREVDRARFQLAAVKAAMGIGDAQTMSSEISVLEALKLPKAMAAETQYFKGRMYELDSDGPGALDAYAKAISMDYPPIDAKAEFRQVELEAKNGTLTAKQEIDKLDALRFKWRGGPLEFNVLHRLGQRYIAEDDYRDGLEIMRQAVSYFPESDATRAITQEMNKIFRKLFLADGADKMAPVAALGLYYDFRELTPLGPDGDEMIRKLSERLVKVDLLDKAEELLEHQVKYRLKGAAQAQVAARLARVYLLDRKPQQAIDIIRETRQVLLSKSVAHMRLMLEAKALTDLKRYKEAEGTLEGIKGEDAELVRSDIYWAAKDWRNVASNAEKLLADRWKKPGPLEPVDRQTVMRWAVALALENDQQDLATLQMQYDKLMAKTQAANAFNVVTTTVDPTGINLHDLTSQIASVNTIEKLFADYNEPPTPAS